MPKYNHRDIVTVQAARFTCLDIIPICNGL